MRLPDDVTVNSKGNVTGGTGTVSNPFRFAGRYTDAEAGLQYLRNGYANGARQMCAS
jgi:hypothetical protein